ncbi:anti-repressor SinI family protein [Metabacillus sp. Hm71]
MYEEWVALIIEALEVGISEDEIREFLRSYDKDSEGFRNRNYGNRSM